MPRPFQSIDTRYIYASFGTLCFVIGEIYLNQNTVLQVIQYTRGVQKQRVRSSTSSVRVIVWKYILIHVLKTHQRLNCYLMEIFKARETK